MGDPDFFTRRSYFGSIQVSRDLQEMALSPHRKARDRRRYYRNLSRRANSVMLVRGDWYDLMHWHVDDRGLGNLSWRDRRSHLITLFDLFRNLLDQARTWDGPFQCFVLIDPGNSIEDAVYFHTPNPNENDFPVDLGCDWDVKVPELLREFMTDPTWQFGRWDAGATLFYVRPRPAENQ